VFITIICSYVLFDILSVKPRVNLESKIGYTKKKKKYCLHF
jgi:hypothetical protein